MSQPGAQKPRSNRAWGTARTTVAKGGGRVSFRLFSAGILFMQLLRWVWCLVITFNERLNINRPKSKTMWVTFSWNRCRIEPTTQKVQIEGMNNSHTPLCLHLQTKSQSVQQPHPCLSPQPTAAAAHLLPPSICSANVVCSCTGLQGMIFIFLQRNQH